MTTEQQFLDEFYETFNDPAFEQEILQITSAINQGANVGVAVGSALNDFALQAYRNIMSGFVVPEARDYKFFREYLRGPLDLDAAGTSAILRVMGKLAIAFDVIAAGVTELVESGSISRAAGAAVGTLIADAFALYLASGISGFLLGLAATTTLPVIIGVMVVSLLIAALTIYVAAPLAADFFANLFESFADLLDPLAIDLDGDGVNTTSLAESGVTFDLDNNGIEEATGWFEAEDGILFHDWKGATDENGKSVGDGEAQDRSELFANFTELSRHDLNGDGILDDKDVTPKATEDTNGDGEINADDVILPDEDTNGDGVIDVNDISPFAQDANGNGIIDDDEVEQQTATGDFDGNGTTETIKVGWDQLKVWRDANQNGNVDEGELLSFEELGITSIDLNATELDVEDNGNVVNSESTVTLSDGSTTVINGISFNRDTVNQSYEQQIAQIDTSSEYLASRVDVFTMPQMQGSGNVPHLLIAGLLDDGVLEAWRAVSEFDGTDLVEFKSLVESLLVKWSGAEDVPHEYRGFALPQIINAVEEFLGTEYSDASGDVTLNAQQALQTAQTWDTFLSSMTLRFFAQSSNLNPDNDVVYDFASDTFTGDWSPIISTFETQHTDPAVTAEDKAVITSLLQSIYSATVAEGDGQDLEVASQVEAIINKPLRAPDQIANFFEEFNVGYEDGDNSPLFITINGNTTVIIPPGFELGDNLKDDNLSFATVSNGSPGVVAQFFPHKISKWQGSDSFISAGLGKDTITVGGPWGQAGANNPFGGLHSTFTTQTYVDSRDNDRDNVLNIGSADALEFSREGSHLLITNVETGSTVLVNSQFSSPSVGVNEINFDGSLRIDSRYLENIASEFSGDGGTLSTAQVGQLAWHRGTSEADGIVGTGDSEVFFGGLRDDVLVGLSGGDTYIYRRGDGNDTIIDGSVLGGTDVLFFEDIASTEVNLLRTATDLRVEIVSNGQVITVQDHFGSGSNQTGIEEINFSDGVIFDRSDILDNVVFRGSRFQDTIFGSDRDDTFNGTKGNDVFVGTIGADTYVYASGDGSDTIIERNALVSDVIDTLHLVDLNRDQVELRRTTEDLFVIDKNTGHKITVISEFFQTVNKFGLERILFANGEEMNRSQMASQAVYFGTDLNDVLSGTSGVDEKFDGNKGDDQLSGFSGSETYYYASGDGNDTIIETSTAGRDDTDTLELTDLNRNQIELLRTGDDLTIVDKTTSEQIVVKEQFGGSSSFNFGIENIRFVDGTSIDRSQILAQAIIRGTVNDDNLSGTGGNDIIEGDAGNDVLRGLGGNDQLFGQDGDDRLEDGSGDDDAFGGAGDDYFVVGTGQNDYDGGEGSDTLDYSAYSTAISLNLETESTAGGGSGNAASNDTFTDIENVIGGFGSDTLIGNDEANRLDGYFGNDELRGEGGNDILVDGSGNDDAYGGDGDDLFIVGTGRNHYDGGEGSDTLDYSAYTTAIRIDLETESTAGGGSGNAASNDTFTNIENVIGTAGNDTLIGGENDNNLSGFDGDDILQGQRGDDTLEGGNGADTFIHALGDGADTIIDFNVSEDKIDLSSTRLYFEDILERISVEEGGLLIDLSGLSPLGGNENINTSFDSIFLSGADSQTLGQLTADNFVLSPVPVAYDDDLGEVAEDTSIVIDTAELLANDRGYNLIGFVEDLLGGSVVLNEETETITFTPFANYFGTARFGYLAYSDDPDAAENIGYPAGTVSFTITPVNDAPVLANAIADQDSAEDGVFSFTLPADVFSDVDNASLTLSATLAGGAALPAWLSFDAEAGTFSGTPPQDFNGALSVTVTASDGALETSDTFELEITPVNDAPVVANGLADQSSAEDAAVSFALPTDAFSDVDGDALTLSATLAGGAALPAWLSFDAAAGTFSGTPPQNFNGALSVTVTASDGALEASDAFELEITPVNDAPVVANGLSDQSSAEDAAVSFALPTDAFSDVDGDALTLSATLAGGAALPAWLSFDAAAGTFSGTPPQDFNGALSVTATASDGALEASDTFELEITPVNDAPIVANALADQQSVEDALLTFTLPADTFSDVDNDNLTLSVRLASGGTLPNWLAFDAATRTFSGTPATRLQRGAGYHGDCL